MHLNTKDKYNITRNDRKKNERLNNCHNIISAKPLENTTLDKKALSYDIGPMQINSRHLKKLLSVNVNAERLMNDGCTNIAIGTAILRGYVDKKNDLFLGVGRYNASDKLPLIQKRYSDNVAKEIMSLTDKKKKYLIDKTNRFIVEVENQEKSIEDNE